MLGVILAWLATTITFLSFGDLFIFAYNSICKEKEDYSVCETFIIGLCFTTIVTTILSIALPTNIYTLGLYILLSLVYWTLRKRRLNIIISDIKNWITKEPKYKICFFILPAIGFGLLIIRQIGIIDSLFYHQQSIIWNENYAVVPGLGNMEDRFAFNSNYLLLSALFSLRSVFGEGIYGLQALLALIIMFQLTNDILKSGYELKKITRLVLFILFSFTFSYTLSATSTDAIPSILSFYLITELFVKKDSLNKKTVLFFLTPVLLITFKITTIPLCIFTLLVFVRLVKQRKYRTTIFLSTATLFVLIPWFIRNIIISGYLIFPLYQVDLFSFDWKMPVKVLVQEHEFITYCAIRVWKDLIVSLQTFPTDANSLYNTIIISLYLLSIILSPFLVLFAFVRKKISVDQLATYISAILIVAIWFIGGPDPRFIGGTLFAIPLICFALVLPAREIHIRLKMGISILSFASLFIFTLGFNRTLKVYNELKLGSKIAKVQKPSMVLLKPISYKEQSRAKGIDVENFTTYTMNNNIVIFISKSALDGGLGYVMYDKFPSSVFQEDNDAKFQSIKEIEARGNSLQDGFRPKSK